MMVTHRARPTQRRVPSLGRDSIALTQLGAGRMDANNRVGNIIRTEGVDSEQPAHGAEWIASKL